MELVDFVSWGDRRSDSSSQIFVNQSSEGHCNYYGQTTSRVTYQQFLNKNTNTNSVNLYRAANSYFMFLGNEYYS